MFCVKGACTLIESPFDYEERSKKKKREAASTYMLNNSSQESDKDWETQRPYGGNQNEEGFIS